PSPQTEVEKQPPRRTRRRARAYPRPCIIPVSATATANRGERRGHDGERGERRRRAGRRGDGAAAAAGRRGRGAIARAPIVARARSVARGGVVGDARIRAGREARVGALRVALRGDAVRESLALRVRRARRILVLVLQAQVAGPVGAAVERLLTARALGARRAV